MAKQTKNQGNVPAPQGKDRSGNYDKKRNQPAVEQGISNAGPTGNRNDRDDTQKSPPKSGNVGNTDPKKKGGNSGNRDGSKSNAERKE